MESFRINVPSTQDTSSIMVVRPLEIFSICAIKYRNGCKDMVLIVFNASISQPLQSSNMFCTGFSQMFYDINIIRINSFSFAEKN